jgi:hypothetical protein
MRFELPTKVDNENLRSRLYYLETFDQTAKQPVYRFSLNESLESLCSHEIHEDAGHWE